jgi:hypothetical protein
MTPKRERHTRLKSERKAELEEKEKDSKGFIRNAKDKKSDKKRIVNLFEIKER